MAVTISSAWGRHAPRAGWASRSRREALWLSCGIGACLLVALGLVHTPWVVFGVMIGAVLILAVLASPLAVVGVMLVIGPIDLSFATGGFKALFPELGGLDMNGIRLMGMTAGLAAIALVDREVLRHALGRWGRWYLVFLVYAACTLLVSRSALDGARLLLKLAYPFLVFIVVLGVARTRSDLERLADFALAGAAAIALVVTPLFLLGGAYVVDAEGRLRLPGVGLHQNPMSFYMLLVLLLAFTRFAVRGQLRYLLLCAPFAIWMVLAQTRITLAASVAALATAALYGAFLLRRSRALAAALLLAAAVAIPMVPVALHRSLGYVPAPSELINLFRDPGGLVAAIRWQGREIFWPIVAAAFLSSPFFGLGLGSSTAVITANFPTSWGAVVHNEYLRVAADTGLVGVVLLAVAVLVWWSGAMRAGRTQDLTAHEFALPAVASIAAWAVISITDNPLDYYGSFTQYVAFLCAGALAAGGLGGAVVAERDLSPGREERVDAT